MDALHKLQLLGPAAQLEPAEDVNLVGQVAAPPRAPLELRHCLSHATLPNGQRIPMLKTLLSSACEMNCRYCAFRAGRDGLRATFSPDELARLTQTFYAQGIIQGVFLSSGLAGGGVRTQDRIIATAELLRRKYQYRGYLHLKIMPGAEREQIAAAMRLADRVSINLEAPNAARLADLAPRKQFSTALFQRLKWIHELQLAQGRGSPSATTQFVVGAVDEPDVELLSVTAHLHRELGLARAYFSRFSPVPQTPLEAHAATLPQREARLYQASFLLRDYGFDVEELPFDASGNLPLTEDPKLAWARLHLLHAPVEVNTADRELLLRIPGIGLQGVERILRARCQATLRDVSALHKLGIAAGRALPYILLDGRAAPQQLTFWPVAAF